MTDIGFLTTVADVRRIKPRRDEVGQGRTSVAVTQAALLAIDASGELILADGSAAGTAVVMGVSHSKKQIGEAVGFTKRGKVAGFDVSGLDVGALLYLSDTAGKIADAAGTVSLVVGRVGASMDDTPVKYVHFDINYAIPGV